MSQPIVRQPDGKFAIFSTETDTFVRWDCTRDEVVTFFVDQAVFRATAQVQHKLNQLEDGQAPDTQLAYTWEELLARDAERGGQAWRTLRRLGEETPPVTSVTQELSFPSEAPDSPLLP